jgi:dCTP deaminase
VLLNHEEIWALVEAGAVEGALPEHLNGTSLDITLGSSILAELPPAPGTAAVIDYRKRTPPRQRKIFLDPESGSYTLAPGAFILAASREIFNLPPDVSAEFKLKSSAARVGMSHLLAAWCDPTWNGSCLTMELVNVNRYHSIRIRPGDRIGQMVFFRNRPVLPAYQYAVKGRYNNDLKVKEIKL